MPEAVHDLLAGRASRLAMPAGRGDSGWPGRSGPPSSRPCRPPGSTTSDSPDCRHHLACWFMMRGGSLKALKELLGHQDIKTTLIYTPLEAGAPCAEVAKTERPAPTSEAVSTKSPQNSSATVESEERVR